jgi:F-type H+-transporting ATPase subunit delta
MAEPSTIARPYAEAVFKLADGQGKLPEWSENLANLAQLVTDERMLRVIGDPKLSASNVAGTLIGVLAGRLSGDAENFVRVLAENRRVGVLGEIRAQFEALKHEREGVVEARVETAFPLDDAQLADLVARIEKHTGRKVKASISVDKELIGGVRVTIGDKVIDASARAQLAALESALKN